VKVPSEFSAHDWLKYLRDELRRRDVDYDPPTYVEKGWVNGFAALKRDGVDPYTLAIATDVLAMDWVGDEDPWWALSARQLLRPLRLYGRPPEFWRYVWFSRFARTSGERAFLSHWLSTLDSAYDDPPGAQGRADRIVYAISVLEHAEDVIREEDRVPSWKLDWVRNRREALSRWIS